MSGRLSRMFNRIKGFGRGNNDPGSDSDSGEYQPDKPRRETRWAHVASERYGRDRSRDLTRNYRQPSPTASSRSQYPRSRGSEVSIGTMEQQSYGPGVIGLGISYGQDSQQEMQSHQPYPSLSSQNNPSSRTRTEKPLPYSKAQRQHRVTNTDTSQMPRPPAPASAHFYHPVEAESSETPLLRTSDVSSRPASPPGIPTCHTGSPVDTSEEAMEIAMNRKEALDCLRGTIPARVFTMPDFAEWRSSKTPREARNLANAAGLTYQDFYRFIPRTQFGLAPERQKRLPPQHAQVPMKAVRTDSMRVRLEEMKGLMKQTQDTDQKPSSKPSPSSRLPISAGHRSRRVAKPQMPTPRRPMVNGRELAPPKTTEEEDADLQAAIAASLADIAEQKRRPRSRLPRLVRPNMPWMATEHTGYVSSTERPPHRAQEQTAGSSRVQNSRRHLPDRPTHSPPLVPHWAADNSTQPPQIPRRSSRRGNPRDPTTGEYLSEDAWNSQIF
ncbi:hypothetical protein BR93DRAFT_285809 [Coniochaeta sp. PMI_546]|nr:hypothetical protein BR93DRAFT_285809 [Coniochaeta sp. PMI_546]